MIIINQFLQNFAIVFTVAILTLIVYIKWTYAYWSRVGLKYIKPTFPFGNFWGTFRFKTTVGEEMEHHYFQTKSQGANHTGIFLLNAPFYLPTDVDIIKHILKADFANFEDRITYHKAKCDPLSEHLVTMEGEKWKQIRAKVSTIFTPSKMKMMFPLIVKTCEQMTGVLDGCLPNEDVEFTKIFSRLTIYIIINCAFGIELNNMRGQETDFEIEGKKFFHQTLWRKSIMFMGMLYPKVMEFLGIRVTPKSTEKLFLSAVHDVIKYREENNVIRNDLLQLLISLKSDKANATKSSAVTITENEIAGVAFGFFAAGYETTSTTLSFCLYELAQNEMIQEKMRNEIYRVLSKHNGELTYEAVMELSYMENVVNETMRKYPPVPVITRKCNGDSIIPNTKITLKKGISVAIPIQAVHHDPEYYPNPDVFDPDRFTDENRRTRDPYAFIPFGEGPRICIGYRFGMIMIKVGMVILLKNYKFKLSSKTRIPLLLDPEGLFNSISGGMWVNVEKITQ